ncbi:hypothetical protein JTE90_020134 [Oedothorax gibbosus]|uniref:Citramalyl-CoA lyase, mitochondrial n=1 Tax=Oedothorax gibbosus TaxID=931172 RepID=A0AAV6UAM4_9ARAC|nr:hypothetical protein JTE90_020134 [Oedothorax gibbosus]
MYVPGHDRKKINKLSTLDVDCAVLDCEDGVAVNKKAEAREMIKEVADSFDFGKKEFAVRINSIDSNLAEEDLRAVLSSKNVPETLMIPKVEDSDQVLWIFNKLKSSFKPTENGIKLNLIFFIESAKSLLNMQNICKTSLEMTDDSLFRFEGVVFGSDDFCADIGATRSENGTELLTARQLFVIVAKSFKVQAIDMVHINYKDLVGLQKNCEDGANLGFTGKQVIHPSQIPIVQKAFSPSAEKIAWAKELIHLFNEHQNKGTGAFTFRDLDEILPFPSRVFGVYIVLARCASVFTHFFRPVYDIYRYAKMSAEESKVQNICNCLSILTTDIKIADPNDATRQHRNIKEAFAAELKRNVHSTFQKIEDYPNIKVFVVEYIQPCCNDKCTSCDYLKFLQLCLVLLRLLKTALTKEVEKETTPSELPSKAPKGLLSISQKKTLQKCLQFAVALGILPNLLRGIGIPLSRRLKHAIILEHFTSESTLYQKHIQIAVCLDTLIGCLDCDAMQSMIMTYHGTDILAALLQLCHAPIKKIEKNEASADEPATSDNTVTSETQIVNMMLAHRKYFTPHLESFLKQISPSLLMWELLLFQGIPIQSDSEPIIKTPSWLKRICNQMLTDLILQSYGIARLVQVIFDKAFDSDIQNGRVEGSRMDAVARLITYSPVQHIPIPEYIEKISKQVFQCLHLNGSSMDNIIRYIAACIILQFFTRCLYAAEEHFLVRLVKPLWFCVRPPASCSAASQSTVIVKESELTMCLEDLHQIFVVTDSVLSRKFIRFIYPYSHCLLNIFFPLLKGKYFLKPKVKRLVKNILTNISDDEALSLLQAVSFSNSKDKRIYITKVSFAYGDDGGLMAVPKVEEEFSDEIIRYRAILDLLNDIQNKNLNRLYILLVLKEFCTFHLDSKDNIMDPENIKKGILFNALLQELSEWNVDIGEALMSNISEVIDILMTLLESICNCRTDATFYEKTLWVVLMILNSILESDDQLTPADWASLKLCLPSLQTLQMSDVDLDLKEIIFSIIIHIATHGAACKNGIEAMKDIMTSLPDTANLANVPSEQCLMEIIERYERECSLGAQSVMSKPPNMNDSRSRSSKKGASGKKNAPKHSSKKSKESASKKRESPYEAAVKDVKSSSIPMRGHGLISLGTLLKEKDEATLQSKKDLLNIFQENLEDDDSYVYLSAIQGLSLLADIDAELVLPIVLSMYQKGEKASMILKLGEVLKKIVNSLGDMIHKYKDQLLHTFLIGTKRDDPQIRSSSLSDLGEVCMLLKCNINGHWLQEILICVTSFLKTDPDIEVRKCSVMVIHLLLKGVGKDMIKVLENEIKTIYMQLKIVYTTETDDVLRLHAQLALEEINTIMKELLCAKVPLAKEIRILQ